MVYDYLLKLCTQDESTDQHLVNEQQEPVAVYILPNSGVPRYFTRHIMVCRRHVYFLSVPSIYKQFTEYSLNIHAVGISNIAIRV